MSLKLALGGMGNLPQFFIWRMQWDGVKAKYIKTPCALDGSVYRIDASEPKAWTTFDVARAAAARLNAGPACAHRTLQYALGFYLTTDCGYWFLDFDNCMVDGQLQQFYSALLASFPGSAQETSSSGRGVHAFGRCSDGAIPRHSMRNTQHNMEFYTEGRGIAFGLDDVVQGCADTPFPAAHLQSLIDTYFPYVERTMSDEPRPAWRGPADDDELIRRALAARESAASVFGGKPGFGKLWRGECEHDSSSDMALASHLAFWTGCDAPRIERLMRRSGLVRDKWDTHRPGGTYLTFTIGNACDGCDNVYQERQKAELPPLQVSALVQPTVRNAQDLLSQEFKPVQWAIRDLLPEGVTILSGDPKIGKSWLVYQMCVAIATGCPLWPGRVSEAEGDALYLDLEGNDRRLKRRLVTLLKGFPGANPTRVNYATDWPRAELGVQKIAEWLRQNPECRIVVIDTISAFRDNDPGRKSAYAHDYVVGEMLKPLAREFNCAIVIVMHNRKQAAGDVMHKVSGTQGMTGSVDNVLILERGRGDLDAVLHVDGRDIEETKELALRLEAGLWRCVGALADVLRSKERTAVIDALKSMKGVGTSKDIHGAMDGKRYGAVKTMLSKMVKAGELRNDNGLYTVAFEIPLLLKPPPVPGASVEA